RVFLLTITLLSAYRLMKYVSLSTVVRAFFWMCVLHSLFVIGPFIASGGQLRSFGYVGLLFDELSMLALPIGLAHSFFSRKDRTWPYLLGSFIVLAALGATQSRAPIIFALVASLLVLFFAWRSSSPGSLWGRFGLVRRQVSRWLLVAVVSLVILVVLNPEFIGALYARFERLLTTNPTGTFLLRLQLWKVALTSFADNPFLGAGPGMYRYLGEIYVSQNLTLVNLYVRGLTAHNLLLHYLAETGLIGGLALLSLFGCQFSLAVGNWRRRLLDHDLATRLSLLAISFLLLISTLVEAAWMWANTGYMAVFFMAAISRMAASDSLAREQESAQVS
ncbi:MAG: O-antigen ligase family protein, partial [candidate division Zixibacteria bacterium]